MIDKETLNALQANYDTFLKTGRNSARHLATLAGYMEGIDPSYYKGAGFNYERRDTLFEFSDPSCEPAAGGGYALTFSVRITNKKNGRTDRYRSGRMETSTALLAVKTLTGRIIATAIREEEAERAEKTAQETAGILREAERRKEGAA